MPGLGRSWDELFQALVHYKELHGDCNVPQYYQQDPGLGQWVGKQRSKYGDPNDPKHIRLSSIDFDWTSQEERNENIWNEKFGRLLQYKAKHGHCRVPKGFKDDPELGNFVSMQRILKKKERLSKDRQDKLDSVQFTWELVIVKNNHGGLSTKLEEKWMEKYAKLVEYKHLHGHCIVPKMYKPDGLGYWVGNMRAANRNGDLLAVRKVLLDRIGFVWSIPKNTKKRDLDEMRNVNHSSQQDTQRELLPESSSV